MTGESEMATALPNAFWMALLLTGNVEAAEAAALDGIAALELERISGDSLLLATANSAMRRRNEIAEQSEGFSILPSELRRLFLLAPNYRDCFVLRALIGLSPELCSRILHLSIQQVENALYTALQEVSRIETWDTIRRDSVHPLGTQRWTVVLRHLEYTHGRATCVNYRMSSSVP
jgi:hypothetical protein